MTSLPDNNPKTVIGITKPPTFAIPPVAIIELGGAMSDGEVKYGLTNWRENAVSVSVYYDAMMRHLFAYRDGEDRAKDSGRRHLSHVMACCSILLDAEASGTLIDDRGNPGAAAEWIEKATRQAVGLSSGNRRKPAKAKGIVGRKKRRN